MRWHARTSSFLRSPAAARTRAEVTSKAMWLAVWRTMGSDELEAVLRVVTTLCRQCGGGRGAGDGAHGA